MKTRIRILKILGVLGLVVMIVFMAVSAYGEYLPKGTMEYERVEKVWFVVFGIYAIIGVLIVILTCIGGKPEPKPIDKYDLLFGDALQLRHALQGSTGQQGYECLESDEAWLISRRWEKKRCHVFALRFLEEMQREDIGPMYDHMYAVLKENGIDPDRQKICLMLNIVVNRTSSSFYSYLKSAVEQGKRMNQYYAGATLGGDIFYLPELDIDVDLRPGSVRKIKWMREETRKIWEVVTQEREGKEKKANEK